MMSIRLTMLALLVLPSAALRVAQPLTRRNAVAAGASLIPTLVLPPRSALADSVEEIAARSNAAAMQDKANKKKAEESQGLFDAAGDAFGLLLTGGIVAILGGVGVFVSSISGQGGETVNLDMSRPLTDAEKRKYAKLSASEKRKLGIKGL